MKLFTNALLVALFCVSISFAQQGVIKKTSSKVEFAGFGNYTVSERDFITAEQKRSDEKTKFKGKGFLKGTIAKLILKSGDMGRIDQPLQKRIVHLDHKKKRYWIDEIKEMDLSGMTPGKDMGETGEPGDMESEEPQKTESDIEIIRTVFKVTDHSENKTVGDFNANKYSILWVMEWRNKVTEEKGTDSLYTLVWTTPYTDEIKNAMKIEQEFAKNQLGAMGIEVEEMQREAMLGLNWLKVFGQLNKNESETRGPDTQNPEWVEEMKKLKGFPVEIDGEMFNKRKKPEGMAQTENESNPTDVKGALGGMFKKKLFGKKKSGEQSTIAYYTRTGKYGVGNVGDDPFKIPRKYKEKK